MIILGLIEASLEIKFRGSKVEKLKNRPNKVRLGLGFRIISNLLKVKFEVF